MSFNQTHGNNTISMNNDDAYWYAKYMKYKGKYMEAKELMGGAPGDTGVDFLITIAGDNTKFFAQQDGSTYKLPGWILNKQTSPAALKRLNAPNIDINAKKSYLINLLKQQKNYKKGGQDELEQSIGELVNFISDIKIIGGINITKITKPSETNLSTLIHITLQDNRVPRIYKFVRDPITKIGATKTVDLTRINTTYGFKDGIHQPLITLIHETLPQISYV